MWLCEPVCLHPVALIGISVGSSRCEGTLQQSGSNLGQIGLFTMTTASTMFETTSK